MDDTDKVKTNEEIRKEEELVEKVNKYCDTNKKWGKTQWITLS